MPYLLASLVATSLFHAVSASIGPIATLSVGNLNIAPDGFTRSTVLAGGTFPGPVIVGNKGDNFQLNVVNGLTDVTMDKTTSIHWHGLFQKETPWVDGPTFVTQCPIASGDSFLYDFYSDEQAGTYWYHSHMCAFVIYDPSDPHLSLYDVDDENTVITVGDWYHVPSPQEGPVPTPDSTVINGKGRHAGGPASPLAIVNVVQGTKYRFRLASISCDPNFVFSIDGHSIKIIEVDGENVVPIDVDSI